MQGVVPLLSWAFCNSRSTNTGDCVVTHFPLSSHAVVQHHGADVCLNNDGRLVVCECEYGIGGILANARQCEQLLLLSLAHCCRVC